MWVHMSLHCASRNVECTLSMSTRLRHRCTCASVATNDDKFNLVQLDSQNSVCVFVCVRCAPNGENSTCFMAFMSMRYDSMNIWTFNTTTTMSDSNETKLMVVYRKLVEHIFHNMRFIKGLIAYKDDYFIAFRASIWHAEICHVTVRRAC